MAQPFEHGREVIGQRVEELEARTGPGVAQDDAVIEEAMAQFLDDEAHVTIPEVMQTYTITDTDRVVERLLSTKTADQMQVDLSELRDDDSPPPRGAFLLLDRELPEDAAEPTAEQMPEVQGEILIYGRETDREARACFLFTKSRDAEQKIAAFKEILGEYCGELVEEEETGEVPAESVDLGWRWRLPSDRARAFWHSGPDGTSRHCGCGADRRKASASA